MNKVLLFLVFFLGFHVFSYSSRYPKDLRRAQIYSPHITGDSTLLEGVLGNPKAGFKDLFLTDVSNSIYMSKLNPKALSFVQDYIGLHAKRLKRMKNWGRPYFEVISTILAKHGLPIELKYLSVIESDLKSSAVSWVGAVGPWQLMPSTARDLGLSVNHFKDERRDYYKSTHAAALYLTDLYDIFNDWLLVIAAYNSGPAHVFTAMRKSHSRNFWDLQNYLPSESRNHVKKFIATHYIMEGDGGLTCMTRKETNRMLTQTSEVKSSNSLLPVSGRYNAVAVAQGVEMNFADFNQLNPNFDKLLVETGSYNLNLPIDKVALFKANKSQILDQSLRLAFSIQRQ
ncbi:MAG: hypothetical protein NVS9B7_19890 [Flavisolibacter sp.]